MLSSGFGRAMRSLGQAIDRLGVRVQGEHAYIETCTWLLLHCVCFACLATQAVWRM